MSGIKSKFETEVHLGLLVIIFLLLFVNFISNIVLYRARTSEVEMAGFRIQSSSVAIGRALQENYPRSLPESEFVRLKEKFGLTDITIVDSGPNDNDPATRRKWFVQMAPKFPPAELPDLGQKLLSAEFQKLTRGRDKLYFYVSPVHVSGDRKLLILSMNLPQLAHLEDASRVIQLVSAGSFVIVALVYLLLSRYIFGPIRKITKQARMAGRDVEEGENEIEAVARDYEQIIKQLRENEIKLMRMNEGEKERSASLEQFNQYLLDSMESGIVTLDNDGKILSDNEAARQLLDKEDSSFIGRNFKELFSICPELSYHVVAALEKGIVSGYREVAFRDDDDKRRCLGVSLSFIRDKNEKGVGLAVLLNDLTELRELRGIIEQKNKLAALGEMAAGLAHQIRNSLCAISGYGALVKRRKSDDESEGYVESLLQETIEAESLINRFLTFSRPLSLERTIFHVGDFLSEIVESFRVRPVCEQIRFDLRGDKDIKYNGDSVLLKQVLSNIIDNAVDACEGGSGVITITSKVDNRNLTIAVKDTGSGIPSADVDKLFTPFFSSRPSGTGLGLSLAIKIVDLHEGKIEVESKSGEGSCFLIHLPILNDSEQALLKEKQSYDLG